MNKDCINKLKNTALIILFALILTIFSLYPIFNDVTIAGNDISYHLTRISEIADGIRNGEVPLLIHSNMLGNMGYANSIFYPELFLYIPAILLIITGNLMFSYKTFLFIITFFTIIVTYMTTNLIFKNKKISILTTILYTVSLYRIVDIFERAAVGEILAFLFLPILVYGIYSAIFEDIKKCWLIVVGIFCLANSHVISFVIGIGVLLFICICNIDKIFKEKKRFIYLLCTALFSVIICSSVFFPMLEQMATRNYNVTENGTTYKLENTALTLSQVFVNEFKYTTINKTTNDIYNSSSLSVGVLILILPLLFLFVKKETEYKRFLTIMFVLGGICLVLTTKIFPWKYFDIFSFIQFPYRLNIVVTYCFSIVGAYSVYNIFEKNKDEYFKITLLITFLVCFNYMEQVGISSLKIDDANAFFVNSSASIGNGEYLPNKMDVGYIKENENFVFDISNKENKINFNRKRSTITFDLNNINVCEYINVPFIYYKGYVATIQNQDNEIHNIELTKNENGLIKLNNKDMLTGLVKVEYKMTIIQKLSYFLTYISVIIFIIYVVILYLSKYFCKMAENKEKLVKRGIKMENIIKKIKELIIKYKEVISYLIFGVLTTLVNILSYELFTKLFHVDYLISTVIAWIISVIFAYVTNKIFVFESKTNTKIEILKEITSFVGFRLLSGVMDIGFMYITVDIFSFNDSLMKIASNVVVVILNYLFSKLFIFKKKKEKVN